MRIPPNKKFGVVIDAGSSGSRVQVYSWWEGIESSERLPSIEMEGYSNPERNQGISSFAGELELLGQHLQPLLDHAQSLVPPAAINSTPLFLLATAGMRMLTQTEQEDILAESCRYIKTHSSFFLKDCSVHVRVIEGKTEALYGWVALKYLLNNNTTPTGFLDLGGASAQIAFEYKNSTNLTLVRLRSLDGRPREYTVFASSWLGYGANEARNRYLKLLSGQSSPFVDPCLPTGAEETLSSSSRVGTGDLDSCLHSLNTLLAKDIPCISPCLFGGVHSPPIDFAATNFVGVSEYWHSINDLFGLGGPYNYTSYSHRVSQFCAQNWTTTLEGINNGTYGNHISVEKAKRICFNAAWVIVLLHDGFGLPKHTHSTNIPFRSAKEINSVDISWPLGTMLLYASSQIPSKDPLPVGFGPLNDNTSFHNAGPIHPPSHYPPTLILILIFLLWLFFGRIRRFCIQIPFKCTTT